MSSNVVCRRVMYATSMHTRSYVSMHHCLMQTDWSQLCKRIYLEDEIGHLVLSHVPLLIKQDHLGRAGRKHV